MDKAVAQDLSEKKEFLESFLKTMEAVCALQEELKDWQELSTDKPTEGLYSTNIILKKQEIEKLENEAEEIRIEILKAINTVGDVRCRRVMRYKYIGGYTYSEIAEKLYYSVVHVKRLNKQGIECIKI